MSNHRTTVESFPHRSQDSGLGGVSIESLNGKFAEEEGFLAPLPLLYEGASSGVLLLVFDPD